MEDHLSDEETLLLHFKRKKLIKRKKRSERKKNRYESEYIHLDEQEVAMCLIMLSKHNNNNNILDFDLSDDFSQDPDRNTTKVMSLKDLKEKNTQFECTTCNKMFHSYQALGGHRASHNKNNNNLLQSPPQLADVAATCQPKKRNKKIKDNKSDNHHECPVCFKVFQSGQALGGHKRSHLLASQGKNNPSQASVVLNPVPEIITRSFLDLNLPAPTEDEEDEEGDESCSITVGSFKLHQPWWVVTAN